MLNEHDHKILRDYFVYWLILLIFGVIGILCNCFAIFVTLKTGKKEIESLRKVLLNVEISTTICLFSYTLSINQVYKDNITYFFGFFSVVFSIQLQLQQMYQMIVTTINYLAYCLYGLALYNHLIPPMSFFHLEQKSQRIFVFVYYFLYILSIPKIVRYAVSNNALPPGSEYGFFKTDTDMVLRLYVILCAILLILILHMVYLFLYGPKLSKQTQKVRLLFIKFSIPITSSIIITTLLSLFIPQDLPWLVSVLRICSHLHLALTNVALLVFIKPLRRCAQRILNIEPPKRTVPKVISIAVSSQKSSPT